MDLFDPTALAVLLAAVALLATLAWRLQTRHRLRGAPGRRAATAAAARAAADKLDTVQAWPPTLARVLSIHERQAYELLRRALPGFMVLAQVPLARFVRVPTRHSYGDWIQRVGSLSADLLLCDGGSRVLAVVDIRAVDETPRARHRHERLARVLQAAGVHVHVWREGHLPTVAQVRSAIGQPLAAAHAPAGTRPTPSRPMPLIPVPDIATVLAAGDAHAYDNATEPVPSAFFDDMETAPRATVARVGRQLTKA